MDGVGADTGASFGQSPFTSAKRNYAEMSRGDQVGIAASTATAIDESSSANNIFVVPDNLVFNAATAPLTQSELNALSKVRESITEAANVMQDGLVADELAHYSGSRRAPEASRLYVASSPAEARLEQKVCIPLPKDIQDAIRQSMGGAARHGLDIRGGIFPSINRAWVTVDEKLFLWDYVRGSSVLKYADIDQVIVSVCLVEPVPNLFVDRVRHLLVIAYPLEVVLLAVETVNIDANVAGVGSSSGTGVTLGMGIGGLSREIELHHTGFSVPTDGVAIRKIVGSPNGRIFMAGDDGNIYELAYQQHVVSSNAAFLLLGFANPLA